MYNKPVTVRGSVRWRIYCSSPEGTKRPRASAINAPMHTSPYSNYYILDLNTSRRQRNLGTGFIEVTLSKEFYFRGKGYNYRKISRKGTRCHHGWDWAIFKASSGDQDYISGLHIARRLGTGSLS